MDEQNNTVAQRDDVEIPVLLTVSPSPHIKHRDTTSTVMRDVLIALTPALLWACWVFGTRALAVTALCMASCMVFEWLTQKLLRRPITVGDLSAAVTGMLLGFNLPVGIPYWMCIIGSAFAIVVVKQLFGGIGKNFLNPALAARVFLFSWPTQISTFTAPYARMSILPLHILDGFTTAADAVASATPLNQLRAGEASEVSLAELFFGEVGGCLGEVSALLLLIGGAYLLLRRVITWHIPTAYLGTVALLSMFLTPEGMTGIEYAAVQLCSGGLMLGAFFMATDYVTSPVTSRGRLLFGAGCGLITVLIRHFGGYVEGVSFSILIMNSLVWYIDRFTRPRVFGGGPHD